MSHDPFRLSRLHAAQAKAIRAQKRELETRLMNARYRHRGDAQTGLTWWVCPTTAGLLEESEALALARTLPHTRETLAAHRRRLSALIKRRDRFPRPTTSQRQSGPLPAWRGGDQSKTKKARA